jgi:hypothetical protein
MSLRDLPPMEALIAALHKIFYDNSQVGYYNAISAVMANYDHYNDGSDY